MVKEGKYRAIVMSHAISETKKGDPKAVVTLKFEDELNHSHTIYYHGSFSEKAAEWTIGNLLNCGLEGNNPAGPLKIGKEVMITIKNEVDEKGVPRNRVAWINEIKVIKNVIPADAAKAKLSSLEGAVMLARQKLGVAASTEEIPF